MSNSRDKFTVLFYGTGPQAQSFAVHVRADYAEAAATAAWDRLEELDVNWGTVAPLATVATLRGWAEPVGYRPLSPSEFGVLTDAPAEEPRRWAVSSETLSGTVAFVIEATSRDRAEAAALRLLGGNAVRWTVTEEVGR